MVVIVLWLVIWHDVVSKDNWVKASGADAIDRCDSHVSESRR